MCEHGAWSIRRNAQTVNLGVRKTVNFGTFGGTIKTTVWCDNWMRITFERLGLKSIRSRANKKKLDEKLRTALIQLPNRAPHGLTARR